MRSLIFAAALFAACPAIAQTGNGPTADNATGETVELPDSATPLTTSEDWYDCAGFLFALAVVEADGGADVKIYLGLMLLKWTAQVKGEKLAVGSNADPTDEDLDLTRRQGPGGIAHVEELRTLHLEKMRKGDAAADAHTGHYTDRCVKPAIELATDLELAAGFIGDLRQRYSQTEPLTTRTR